MKNHNFAKLLPDGKIEYADSVLRGKYSVTISPSAEEYLQFGFLPVEDIRPQSTASMYYVKDGWKKEDQKIKAIYKGVEVKQNDQPAVQPNFIQKALRKIAFKLIGTNQ